MFNVKRIISVGFIALVLGISMLILPFSGGKALAHTTSTSLAAASCTYDGCDNKSPASTGCSSSAVTERSTTSGDLGGGLTVTINLRFSTSCHAAWGQEVFNKAAPSTVRGHAELWRLTDNADVNCNSSGGNGDILAGQTACYTPMLGDGPSESAAAYGWVSYDSGYSWNAPVSTTPY